MKTWTYSAAALAMAWIVGSSQAALACLVDKDCDCGQVCSWLPPNNVNHACVDASTGDPGWCDADTDCIYQGQTCASLHCTPVWDKTSICTLAGGTTGGNGTTGPGTTGPGTTGPGTTAGTTGGDTTGGTTAGGTTGGGTTGPGTTAGTTGSAAGGGTTGGGTTGGGTTGGGTTGGGTTGAPGPACTNDVDCVCGQVCSWANASSSCTTDCGNCTDASGGDPGWCSDTGRDNECLYAGQTCTFPYCSPFWSDRSVCKGATNGTTGGGTTGGNGGGTTGGGTTGGTGGGTSCTNDHDCDCGQVCSWVAPHDVNHVCVDASGGDPGWCSGGATDCLYEGQTCSGVTCAPPWSSASVCLKTVSSGTGTTTGSLPDAGQTTSSGGGCSSAGGSFALIVGILAIGLLTRKRKQVA